MRPLGLEKGCPGLNGKITGGGFGPPPPSYHRRKSEWGKGVTPTPSTGVCGPSYTSVGLPAGLLAVKQGTFAVRNPCSGCLCGSRCFGGGEGGGIGGVFLSAREETHIPTQKRHLVVGQRHHGKEMRAYDNCKLGWLGSEWVFRNQRGDEQKRGSTWN